MERRQGRREAVSHLKRSLILDAARRVFENDGLEGASLRAIAAEAGYTPAALYFHFESKEAIYAELLAASLASLQEAVSAAVAATTSPTRRLRAAALAFFDFYAQNPRDLDLGFYLFRGGMRPHGLGREHDERLNAALFATLQPIGEAAEALGADHRTSRLAIADIFAHASGLLLLAHTRRIRIFAASARELMEHHVDRLVAELEKGETYAND
jgi:AcrR family transcriptional regulator